MSESGEADSSDNFGGAWLVTEYVHAPDGTFLGTIAQRRYVQPIQEGRLRVTQICEPSPELREHPMGRFRGEWVFDLEVHGSHRHYLGPAVIGLGTEWKPGAMTGHGVWPGFGYEFESYGVLVAPDRQLTGGFFSLGGRSMADIIGVAVPESAGVEPLLDLSAAPPAVGPEWQLQRHVGPMRIAVAQVTPTNRRRLWAMVDPIGAAEIEVVEDHVHGQQPTVTITT